MGHIKTTEEGKKKLYYSHQCQLVWHAAVSPTLLPIHKKNIFSSHGVSMNNITSQTNPPAPTAPSHMAPESAETQRSRETEGLVPPSVSVCRKPARGARKCLYVQRSSTRTPKQRHMLIVKPTCTCNHTHFFPSISPLLSSHLV